MIDSYHHVSFVDGANEYKFRLAESAEGGHYIEAVEPLRPPTSQVVQGADGLFQMRPDTLVWRIEDWSGGEGVIKWNPQEPNRHRLFMRVDPLSEPGALRGAWANRTTVINSATGTDVVLTAYMPGINDDGEPTMFAMGVLWNSPSVHEIFEWNWATGEFDSLHSRTDSDIGVNRIFIPISPNEHLSSGGWAVIDGDLHRFNTHRTGFGFDSSQWTSNDNSHAPTFAPIQLGDYVYAVGSGGVNIREVSATTPGTSSLFFDAPDGYTLRGFVKGYNRGYAVYTYGANSAVYELIPTTAAGSGHMNLLQIFEQITFVRAWFAAGLLFLMTHDQKVFYLRPGAEYGVISDTPLWDDEEDAPMMVPTTYGWPYASTSTRSFTVFASNDDQLLWMFDHVTGATARVGMISSHTYDQEPVIAIGAIEREGTIHVWATSVGSAAHSNVYMHNNGVDSNDRTWDYALTPFHDFGITSKKQLASIEVSVDLPDEHALRISAVTDGGIGTNTVGQLISNVSSTLYRGTYTMIPETPIEFTSLSLRINLRGDTLADTVGKLFYVEVRAVASDNLNVYHLRLDLADDTGPPGLNGIKKRQNLLALKGKRVKFRNGYLSREAGVYTETEGIIDAVEITSDRAGEAVAAVTFRELPN